MRITTLQFSFLIFQKLFIVPKNNESYNIEYTGLSHNKYLVTDKAAYTGTNNLCGDYFLESTGKVSESFYVQYLEYIFGS